MVNPLLFWFICRRTTHGGHNNINFRVPTGRPVLRVFDVIVPRIQDGRSSLGFPFGTDDLRFTIRHIQSFILSHSALTAACCEGG